MEKDILSKVIEVEREIQEKLREEKSRSIEWIESARKQAEEEIGGEEEQLDVCYKKAVDETVAEAEKQASEIVGDSILETEKLARISDEALKTILLKYIPRIVPSLSSEKGRESS